MSIGSKLSPILEEIEHTLWEYEANSKTPPIYDELAIRASTKIFMSVMLDKMWLLQEIEKIDFKDRCDMANKLGEEIRKLVKTYTNIDTHDLYK